MSASETDKWVRGLRAHSEEERERRRALLTLVNSREADQIVRPPGVEFQFGFFRVEGGVVRFTRWGDDKNWLPETREEFSFEEIEVLASFL